VIDELRAPDMVMHYPMHGTEPRRGRAEVKRFITEFREAFPDLTSGAWDISSPKAIPSWAVGRGAARAR
jgi:hypothetical protein